MQNRLAASTLTAVVLALTAPLAASAGPAATPILGATLGSDVGRLVRLDPSTLEPIGSPLARLTPSWSYVRSDDGNRIALAGGGRPVRIVDTRSGRVVARVAAGPVELLPGAWPGYGHLLALSSSERTVVVLDTRKGRVVARRPLDGRVLTGLMNRGRLVLLVGAAGHIGAPRIVVVRADGRLRSAPLPALTAGLVLPRNGVDSTVTDQAPGLAVDPSGERAAVVDGNGHLAIVDLGSLHVTMHVTPERQLGSAQKHLVGWVRQVEWLTPKVIAVSGTDYRSSSMRPAGLRLIHTGTWTSRLVAARASQLATLDGAAIVFGNDAGGIGLRVYGAAGELRLHRFGHETIDDVVVVGDRAYTIGCSEMCYRAVDPESGRVSSPAVLHQPTELIG